MAVRPAPAADELNWRLIAVAAVPILAGIALLLLGLVPDEISLRW